MKKTALLFCAVCTAAALTACKGDTNTQQSPAMGLEEQTPPAIEGQALYNEVYVWPEQDGFLPDSEIINFTVSNNTDEEIYFNSAFFKLYRVWENGHQEAVPYKNGGDCFTEEAQLAPPHDTTVFTANIAQHYDLPLEEGEYLIGLDNGLTSGFTSTADAKEIIPPNADISMKTQTDVYLVHSDFIRVIITNNGTEDYHVSLTDFAIEKFEDGAVSMTPWHAEIGCETRLGSTIKPGESDTWTLYPREFSGMELQEGQYAVYLNGLEAPFWVMTNLPMN